MEVLTVGLHTAIIYMFIGTLEHGSIALAFTLSKTIKVVILFALLKNKLEDLQLSHNLRFLGKIAIAVGGMVSIMVGYQKFFSSLFDLSAFLPQALLIGTSGSLGILMFLIVILALNVQEVHVILQTIVAAYIKRFRT